jgi:hypothetical protein
MADSTPADLERVVRRVVSRLLDDDTAASSGSAKRRRRCRLPARRVGAARPPQAT